MHQVVVVNKKKKDYKKRGRKKGGHHLLCKQARAGVFLSLRVCVCGVHVV